MRASFVTDRALEFLSESELTTQIGYGKHQWPLVLAKELVDNALDACESADVGPPEIAVTLEPDALTVSDNGPGLKPEIVDRSLDYHIRISDKKHYIAPTRGQLGNALKCLWAAPFVADGERGIVEVTACGLHHRIEVSLDRIAQKPKINRTVEDAPVKNGTIIKLRWPQIASSQPFDYGADFYHPGRMSKRFDAALVDLVTEFSAFNPHATFRFGELSFAASDPTWHKWRTDDPTSPHWYRPEDLGALISAYISNENGGPPRTVRDFVAEFAGLSGTQYRKRVLQEAGISGTLRDLVVDDDVPLAPVALLLEAMQKHSRAIKPAALGIIGEGHLRNSLLELDVAEDTFDYKKAAGVDENGLPFLIEMAFAVKNNSDEARRLIVGMNWSPVFKIPSGHISKLLADSRIDSHDSVIVVIHQVCPRFNFTDHGKGALAE
jgi:DNA topoisomerase VI subunit B